MVQHLLPGAACGRLTTRSTVRSLLTKALKGTVVKPIKVEGKNAKDEAHKPALRPLERRTCCNRLTRQDKEEGNVLRFEDMKAFVATPFTRGCIPEVTSSSVVAHHVKGYSWHLPAFVLRQIRELGNFTHRSIRNGQVG